MSFKVIFLITVALFGATAASVWAQDDVLEQTTALLNSRTERSQVIQNDPNAKKADDQVQALGLSQGGQDAVYHVSASITENLAGQTGGDSERMAEKVQRYMRDPASLEKDLSPEQKAQIHEISKQLEH